MNRTSLVGLISIVVLSIVAASLVGSVWFFLPQLTPVAALKTIALWFDPPFLGYNLMLLFFAVLFPALLAISYTSSMGQEKTRRIRRELGALWEPNKAWIEEYIAKQFHWRDYAVAVSAMAAVVAFGASVLLLLKPISGAANMPGPGLDFSRGANLLLLGPYVEDYTKDGHFHMVVHSLTAFAFGFLGAYIYSIAQLIRGYFCVDLSPSAFISAAVRIIVASTTALVAAFGLSIFFAEQAADPAAVKATATFLGSLGSVTGIHRSAEQLAALLPVLGFFFGYFPSRALKTITHLANRVLRTAEGPGYGSTNLNKVSGMNGNHAFRLEREGIDNVENLATSEPIEIALRTGFCYPQVKAWVGEARLRVHLARHFVPFVERTGIRTFDQLSAFTKRWDTKARGSAYAFLADTMRADGETKRRIAAKLEAMVTLRDLIDPIVDAEARSENAEPLTPEESTLVGPPMSIRRVSSSSIQAS
ncbi:MAG: hypothetical protein QOC81_3735 [Thermoanaerobaculia bacterium]|jgi:hypothetical protein|nr:hypothetical protein [Thermoanaerobaculia bacterium]